MSAQNPSADLALLTALAGLLCLLPPIAAQAEQEQFVLARNGKPNAVVVVPQGAPVPVQFAGHELATHLEQITGAKFPIVETKPEQGNAIVLGENDYSKAAGIDVTKLKRDGYVVSVRPHTVYITGRDDDQHRRLDRQPGPLH